MSRKARLFVPGCVHHIMSRGLDGMALFADDEDRKHFVSLLRASIVSTDFRCYAWTLMTNHYHLVIRCADQPLWRLMKPLNTKYAGYFNKRHGRRGYLFQDRYRSVATQEQRYIQELVRYVHLNPIRGGLCRDLDQLAGFAWCGHGALMGTHRHDFQDTRTVLERFGKSMVRAREQYRAFLEQGLGAPPTDWESLVRASTHSGTQREEPARWVIGDPEFIRSSLLRDRERRLRVARFALEGRDLHWLHRRISEATGIAADSLLVRSRSSASSDARKIFAFVANAELDIPVASIARYLDVDGSAASRMVAKGRPLARRRRISLDD